MNDLRKINSQVLSEEKYAGGYGYYPSDKEDTLDFRTIWRFFIGYKWSILFITLATLMLSLIISLSLTPTYRAVGTIEIQPESEYGDKINEQKGQVTDKSFYETQYEFLRSKALAARVIDKLGIRNENMKDPDQIEDSNKPLFSDLIKDSKLWLFDLKQSLGFDIGTIFSFPETKTNLGKIPQETLFLEHLKVIPLKNARIVTIQYEHNDPEMASKIVNTLANEFIVMNRERHSESMSDAQKFFKKKLATTKMELDKKEKELTAYAKKYSLLTTGNNETLVEKRLLELNLAVTLAENKRIEMESRYKTNSIGVGNSTINPSLYNGVMGKLKSKKHKKQAEYDTLLLGLKNHADIDVTMAQELLQQTRREINALQKRIDAEQRKINQAVRTEKNINHEALKKAFFAADRKLKNLRKELEAQKKKSFVLQDKKIGYNALKRKVEIKRQSYNELLRGAQKVKIMSEGGKNNISILDKADIPYRQFKPDLTINLSLGVIVGLFLGFFVSFLRNMFNDTVRSSEEIEKLSKLPVLGSIPKMKTRTAKTQARLTYDKPKSAIAEACRSLRTTLLFSTDGDPKVLLITSPMPNEGKTTTAINLASAFVQAGKKVLLIDADLRKPSLHNRLKLDNSMGLATCLAGKYDIDDAIQPKVLGDLSVLTAGEVRNNPVGLFSSEKMENLLKELSLTYDNIILDAPPVMGLADSLLLAHISSATLMVVSHGQTNGKELITTCNKIRQARGSLIGCIYTKVGTYDDDCSHDIYAYGNRNQKNYGLVR